MRHVVEPARRVPVVEDADVVVAGAGISGMFAALAAGRMGAKTVLIERFGVVGGNLGPAMVINGWWDSSHEGAVHGIPAEFIREARRMIQRERRYPEESGVISYLAGRWLEQAGVKVLLGAQACAPVMRGRSVTGVFVETVSGRVAVKGKVVVDATGQASLAARAGAPVTRKVGDVYYPPLIRRAYTRPEFAYWNDTELLMLAGGVNLRAYKRFIERDVVLRGKDRAFWAETDNQTVPKALVRAARLARGSGEFLFRKQPDRNVSIGTKFSDFRDYGGGVAGNLVPMHGEIEISDALQMSRLEAALRGHAFEIIQFLRRHAPGFEKAYLLATGAFLGARGGPYIRGEHVLTPDDAFRGARFDDVLFRNNHPPAIYAYLKYPYKGSPDGFDMPYRMTLPRKVENLLVIGRGASYVRRGHDPGYGRVRTGQMMLGQAAGTAAALAARRGVSPRGLDIRCLQRHLIEGGLWLGPPERLKELGLEGAGAACRVPGR